MKEADTRMYFVWVQFWINRISHDADEVKGPFGCPGADDIVIIKVMFMVIGWSQAWDDPTIPIS